MKAYFTLLITVCCLYNYSSYAQTTKTEAANDALLTAEGELPLKELRLFTLIFDHIRRAYVEPVSDQQLLENAVRGMLGEMDPHSDFLDADSFDQVQETTEGKFSGVGIEIGSESGLIKIISPIDDTPAQKAGLKAGDLITHIDNESVQGLSLNEASQKIRGPAGSTIIFTLLRQGENKPIAITVIRGTIKTASVRHRLIEEAIGYLRISQFQTETGQDFVNAISSLRKQQANLKGLIIDLRNNPGGLLQASVEVVDSLINEGLVVYTKGRLENSNTSYSAQAGDDSNGLPIVVLVNCGSASASEIVAGALQDHKRAVIMGTRTFGKGSVQTILPVGDNKGIKLTTARYYTPNGRSIQAEGITPDIVVKPAKITAIEPQLAITEASLGNHLKNKQHKENVDTSNPDNNNVATNDNQLFEAINLLKGLAILSANKD